MNYRKCLQYAYRLIVRQTGAALPAGCNLSVYPGKALNLSYAIRAVFLVFLVAPAPAGAQTGAPSVTLPVKPGVWISGSEVATLASSSAAWTDLVADANQSCGAPDISDQEDMTNVCVLAKALVFARTGTSSHRSSVVSAIRSIVNMGTYSGRSLAMGRELGAYVVAADLIDLKNHDSSLDSSFRAKLRELRTTYTTGGPVHIIDCHEDRPNNWGTHCGATRVAIARYLGDNADLARAAQVFKGYLGDRTSYAGFRYGDTSWQCNAGAPVGINPKGCTKSGHNVDGVLPDDQRRAGTLTWPPPKENYVWEGLQGALMQAVILHRAGYDVFNWADKALYRAVVWLHNQANFPAAGDDTWSPHIINHYYANAAFPAPVPTRAGKNMGYTDWTHAGKASTALPPVLNVSPLNLSFVATQGGANPAPQAVQVSNGVAGALSWTASSNQAWLGIGAASGTTPSSLGVIVNPAGLSAGTYSGVVTIAATGASPAPKLVSVSLIVNPPPQSVTSLSSSPNPVIGGGNATGTLAISSPAPSGGRVVALSSSSSLVRVPASVTVAAGSTSASFTASTSSVTARQQATVTATLNGSVQAVVIVDPPAVSTPPPATCISSGATWRNTSIPAKNTAFTARFDARPNAAHMDGVTGFSTGAASGFSSLAAIVRFNPAGRIDARDGDVYAANVAIPYSAGATYKFRLYINLASKTYNIYVTPPGGAEITLGHGFSFRTEQAGAATLSNLGVVALSGSHSVCGLQIN